MTETCDFIIDYKENEKDIEKWFSIKCKEKYHAFAELFPEKKASWKEIADLYKYERRLAFNVFKYQSFLEEYLRAIIVRKSDDPSNTYIECQELTLYKLINKIKKEKIIDDIINFDLIRQLRNNVDHSKILIDNRNYKNCKFTECFYELEKQLPDEYKSGFKNDIQRCMKNLQINDEYIIFKDNLKT